MRYSIKILIVVIAVFILFLPLLILQFLRLPFTLKNKYDTLVEEQEKVEREGRELISYNDSYGFYEYYKSYSKYHGTIEKIEDNKIYFLVDKEYKGPNFLTPRKEKIKDVEDYEITFDFSEYNLDYDVVYDPTPYAEHDHINYLLYEIKSAEQLKNYIDIGDYYSIEEAVREIVYEGEDHGKCYKGLCIIP